MDDPTKEREEIKAHERAVERYVKHPYFCPFCEHKAVEATKLEAFENMVYQWVRCDKCETEWHDIFELVGIEEVEELALAELNATPGDAEAEAEAREGTGL